MSSPDSPTPESTSQAPALVLRWYTLWLSWAAVFSMSAPIINVYGDHESVWWMALLALGPSVLFVRGMKAALFPADATHWRRDAFVGAVALVPYLAAMPISIRLALLNFEIKSSWVAFLAAGLAVSIGYVVLVVKNWRRHGSVA
jgi:hypothetical protein